MSHPLSSLEYQPDILGEGYEQATLEFPPDTEGTVVATLIRKRQTSPPLKLSSIFTALLIIFPD